MTEGGDRVSRLSPGEAERFATVSQHVDSAIRAVRGGVSRAHLIGQEDDGALLAELFTAEGVGTQISESTPALVRVATEADISDIVEIIRPLEDQGLLVRRSRDRLEDEIEQFFVATVDDVVVGTCAMYPQPPQAELACVAVQPSFQSHAANIGQRLAEAAEAAARSAGLSHLFALTTQAEDWFARLGFERGEISDLPVAKQVLYNYQRNSRVMIKAL